MLTTTQILAIGSDSMFLDTVRYATDIVQERRFTEQTMRTTRYGCDLAGVLQTQPDLGPAWLPIYGGTFAATTRVGVCVGHGLRPRPLRFAARYVGRDADA